MRPQKLVETVDILEKKKETSIQAKLETTTEPVEIIGSGDEQVNINRRNKP